MVSEEEYLSRGPAEIELLLRAIDGLDAEEVEAELESDILTIELPKGAPFVINSHRAARQIWMAAERSAWHFDFQKDRNQWIAERSGDELWATLGRALGARLGRPVALRRPPQPHD